MVPLVATTLVVASVLLGAHWLLIRNRSVGNEQLFYRQLFMLGLTIAGIVAIALSLPVSDSLRNQVIALVGLVVSGILAFSSTTIFANLMAGIMLRVTKPFRTGDFVRIGDHFGRVAERGLLDTEIQSENRELIAIPNTYLIAHPVSRVRESGAIISVSLSLGYDVHHATIEPLLLEAAERSGLSEAFVHLLELGDFSVTYRVSGVLVEVGGLLTARSNLFRAVLDVLHDAGIEIMSPAFMNQRPLPPDAQMIPRARLKAPVEEVVAAESIVFDKAEQAHRLYQEKMQVIENIQRLEAALKEASDDERSVLRETLEEQRDRLKAYRTSTPTSAESADV